MDPSLGEWLLDLGCGFGNQTGHFLDRGLRVIALDRGLRQLKITCRRFPQVFPILADGLRLPIKARRVDLGFSNAVLEHLPAARQRAFIDEFAQTIKRGIIFTPSKFCIVEPHFMVPLFQFVPKKIQRLICSLVPLGVFARGGWEEVNLLSPGEASILAPRARCLSFASFLPGDQIAIIVNQSTAKAD